MLGATPRARALARRWLGGAFALCLSAFAASATAAPHTHVVYGGQRLGNIAKRYGVTVEALCAENDIRPTDPIKPGQKLLIPARGAHVEREHSQAHVDSRSGSRHRSASESPSAPPLRTHKVETGQRLESIAKRYHVSVAALRTENGLDPKSPLKPGRVLIIPDPDAEDEPEAPAAHGLAGKAHSNKKGFLELYTYSDHFRGRVTDKKGKVLPAAFNGVSRVLGMTGSRPELEPRLLKLLLEVSDHFDGRPVRIVSGYRTTSYYRDSRHKISHAVDFSIPGVTNEALRDYLRTLSKVGVGYYPNSSFVHLDVREYAAYWIDYAGPGEPPRRTNSRSRPDPDEELRENEPEDVPDNENRAPLVRGAPSEASKPAPDVVTQPSRVVQRAEAAPATTTGQSEP